MWHGLTRGNGSWCRQAQCWLLRVRTGTVEVEAAVAQSFGCGARAAESGSVRARLCRVNWLAARTGAAVATASAGSGGNRGSCLLWLWLVQTAAARALGN